jgi:hypothetical protein
LAVAVRSLESLQVTDAAWFGCPLFYLFLKLVISGIAITSWQLIAFINSQSFQRCSRYVMFSIWHWCLLRMDLHRHWQINCLPHGHESRLESLLQEWKAIGSMYWTLSGAFHRCANQFFFSCCFWLLDHQ